MRKGKVPATYKDSKGQEHKLSKIVDVPENWQDCIKIAGSEQQALGLFCQAYKVRLQRQMRDQKARELGEKTAGNGNKSNRVLGFELVEE